MFIVIHNLTKPLSKYKSLNRISQNKYSSFLPIKEVLLICRIPNQYLSKPSVTVDKTSTYSDF